jgi:hypothetical protein
VSIRDQREKGILGDDFEGNEFYWDAQVLKVFHGCAEVNILYIQAHVLGTGCRNDAVPKTLGCGEVGGPCRDISVILDEVTPDG